MLKRLATMVAVAAPLSAQHADAGAATAGRVSAAIPTVRFGSVRLRTGVQLHYAEQGDRQGEPFQMSMVSASVPQSFMDGVISETNKVPTRVMRGALDGLLASGDSARLGSVRAPTLVIWGDRDVVFGRNEQIDLYRRIGGAELLSYPGIGHSPHWEAPDRFANDLLGFIKRRGNADP